MSFTNRMPAAILTWVAVIAAATPSQAQAQDGPTRPPVLLADRSLRNADYSIRDTVQPKTALTPKPAPAATTPETAPAPQPAGDPYGFTTILNNYRASAGLPPLAYDPSLSGWASQNNAAQCRHGLGHHVNPGCFQNSGWNYPDARSAAVAWMNSPAHRDNLLAPSVRSFGIAYGPGPYWTMNAR